jgi:hypothetical protein
MVVPLIRLCRLIVMLQDIGGKGSFCPAGLPRRAVWSRRLCLASVSFMKSQSTLRPTEI